MSYAFTTLPLRMQDVHTRIRFVVPPTRACTGRRFTFQRRLVTLWAWLMRFPDCGFLPQISHCCAMTAKDPFRNCKRSYYSTGFQPSPTIRLRWTAQSKLMPSSKAVVLCRDNYRRTRRYLCSSVGLNPGGKRSRSGPDGDSGWSHRWPRHWNHNESKGCRFLHHCDSLDRDH